MSNKLSPEAQAAYDAIQRCVVAVPLKPVSATLEDFPGSVIMPPRPKKKFWTKKRRQ